MKKMNLKRINKKILFFIPLLIVILLISFFCMPIKDGRSLYSNIQYNKKVAAAIQPDNYDKMKIASARITERITGTSSFSTPDGISVDDGSIVSDLEGNDVSSKDNYVRNYDKVVYSVEVAVERNENTTTDLDVLTGGVIKVRVTVPKDPETNIPWLVIKKDGWMHNIDLSDDFTELTANYQVPKNESIIGGIQELSFTFIAQGYVGTLPDNMKPTIEIWMEGNKPDSSSSNIDKKTLTDNEVLYISGKQKYELTIKKGMINRRSTLNGVNGQYLSFGVQLDSSGGFKGMEYPYNGISSKIKLEYYYSDPVNGDGWVKLDRNNEEDRRILDGIKLISSGLICEETDNFWPTTISNKLKDGCYYKGKDRTGDWQDNNPYRYDSGNLSATYENDTLSFNNINNYFYGFQSSGHTHFLVDGFELFIPYYDDGNANYEYQIRLVADELIGTNYQNESTELSVNSVLSTKLINSISGNMSTILERYGCSGCDTSVIPVNREEGFKSYMKTEDGPYEGGEERLIVWTSSLATLKKESDGTGIYRIDFEPTDGLINADDIDISYGIYKNDPIGGIPTNELTNAAVYEDFYWYDTYSEAASAGTISAINMDNHEYRGYGTKTEVVIHLLGRKNEENIGKVGIVRHKIKLYADQERTIEYSVGYNQNYTPSVIDENGNESSRGTPDRIGHSFVISAVDIGLYIYPKSSITGATQTNFNVQDKYITIELKPRVTNLIDEDFNTNFKYVIRFTKYLTYREGSANIEPTRIVEEGTYGGQNIYWELNDISVFEVPTITFQMEMSPFTPNNYDSGATPDAYLTSPAFPTDDGFDREPLTFTNLAGSTIRKNVNKDIIEANESFEITDTIYNISDEVLQNVKTFEILPKNNDGNGSNFHGNYILKILDLAEGQRIYYTTNAINTLGLTPDDDGNLTLKNVSLQNNPQWTEVQINGTIPANATAIGSSIPSIDTMDTSGFKYQVIPSNNSYGDKYIFKSLATSNNLAVTIKSDILRVSIVSRNIEGKAYIDTNRNNRYDSNDSLIPNHQVKLLNSAHQVIETTITKDDGKYRFNNLPSGTYYVDFGQKEYYNIISKGEGSKANSDGLTDLLTELSESPTQVEITVSNIDVGYAKKEATLTTKYLIYGTTTNLVNPVTQTVYYTDSYTASPPSQPISTDYEFYRNDGDPVSGTVDKDNITVIYYYELKHSTITVHHYALNSTTSVAPDQTINKRYTETYETSTVTPTNTNYEYANSHDGDPVSGTVSKDSYVINYYYKLKEATLKVRYVDQNGNDIDPSKNRNETVHWGESYTSEQLSFKNYRFTGMSEDSDLANGTIEKDSVTVIYKYELKPSTLIVKYVDQNGNNIDSSKNRNESVHWGDSYTSEQLTFNNYRFTGMSEDSDLANGTIEKDSVTVIYKYELKPSTITVHHYTIGTTTSIAPDKTYDKKYTEEYSTEPTNTTDLYYEYANEHDGDATSGTVNKDSYVINYYYKLKKGKVITHHYLYNGEETTTKLAPDVSKEWNYTDRYTTSISDKVPKNYEFYKKTDNSEDYLQSPQVDVNYYYQLKDSNLESSITITGPEEITDKNKNVDYHIKYETSIVDYIGNGTVIITNALPYDIDVEKSDLNGGIYNKNNKTITWTHNYSDINSFEEQNNTKKITIEKDISLKYLGIVGRDRNMVSNVKGKITLSNNDRETTDSASTNIKITGKIIVKYVDEDGKEVFPTIEKEDLVGESFVSSANEKEGYNLIERPELEELEFEEEEQEVKYIYKRKTVQIVTKANTGGNITGDEVVLYGDSSTPDKIVIKAKDGYVIESVVINGEKIDIKPNQQQLVLGQFKEMKEDYLVEVSFKEKPVENPNTAILSIGFISVLVAIFFIILVIKKKKIYRI